MSTREVQCGDKVCFEEHHFSKLCTIPISNDKSGCSIPCNMTLCMYETHHNMDCPIWSCFSQTTTTTRSTTTIDPIITTVVPSGNSTYKNIMISSVVMNILLISFIVMIIVKRLKIIRQRHQRQDPERQHIVCESRHSSIIRVQERMEMNDLERISNQSEQNIEPAILNVMHDIDLNQSERPCEVQLDFSNFVTKKNRHKNRPV